MEYRTYGSTQHSKPLIVVHKDRERRRSSVYVSFAREYARPTLFGVCRNSFLFYVYLMMYLMFLICGAMVFSVLETPTDKGLRIRLNSAIHSFRVANPSVTGLYTVVY